MKKIILLSTILLIFFSSYAQKYTISGKIIDKNTGEGLISATVYVEELKTGVVTNTYGFYSITIPKGKYTLKYTYMGYESEKKIIQLTQKQNIDIELQSSDLQIQAINVTAEAKDKNIKDIEMSTNKLQMRAIKKMPAMMGEVDLIKSIQLLPGVQSTGEGSTGFNVRGGGVDQNLILLDDATVYNASHLGGIFSVFNSDAIKDVKLYKGGIPAEYGGRLASILDVKMNEGNSRKFSGKGGIGIISSRLTIESPIIKDKLAFLVAGRRTYIDLFFPLFKKRELLQESKAYFYDFNSKINYKINKRNRIFLSGYFGRDVFSFGDEFEMDYGNKTVTFRYNSMFSDKIFSNFTFIYSDFTYSLGPPTGDYAFKWTSHVIDYSFKNDYTWYVNPNNTIRFGVSSINHHFKPGTIVPLNDSAMFNTFVLPGSQSFEHGIFIQNKQKLFDWISINYGFRLSIFQNYGESTYYIYDKTNPQEYSISDSLVYKDKDFFHEYYGPEPRFGIRFKLNEKNAIKASYNHTYQYMHLASNTQSPTPLDIWFPSSPNVKPQIADQWAIGYFRNIFDNKIESSIEVYYKKMNNVIDFRDHAQLFLNKYLERELRIGEAYSYGTEILIKKEIGKLTGWFSYTYARVYRKIPEINDGKEYQAPYDKPNDIAIVLSYDMFEWLNVSGNWVYSTGAPRTMPTGRYNYQGMVVPVYSARNSVRLPDYHRLDLSVTYYFGHFAKKKRKYEHNINISVYNVYDKHNTYSISFKQEDDNPNITYAEKMYLFRIFPSITYNFNF